MLYALKNKSLGRGLDERRARAVKGNVSPWKIVRSCFEYSNQASSPRQSVHALH